MTTVILNKPSNLKFSGFRLMTSAVASSFGGVRLPYPAVGPLLLRVTDRVVSWRPSITLGKSERVATASANCSADDGEHYWLLGSTSPISCNNRASRYHFQPWLHNVSVS